jgi:thioredoxin 1
MPVLTLTKENFTKEVVQSSIPVAVDFMAKWCAPCKQMEPILEAVAEALDEKKIKLARLDVDLAREVAQQYQIMSVPTILVFKGKKVVEQLVGTRSKKELLEKLQDYAALVTP